MIVLSQVIMALFAWTMAILGFLIVTRFKAPRKVSIGMILLIISTLILLSMFGLIQFRLPL